MLTWGDSDFLWGLPFAAIGQAVGHTTAQWLLPVIACVGWLVFPIINGVKKILNKNPQLATLELKESNNNEEQPNLELPVSPSLMAGAKNKLIAVCGQGLGSSLLIEMNIKSVVDELKIKNIEVSHTNVNSFDANDNKILAVVCGNDLKDSIKFTNKLVLDNLLDKNELKGKLQAFFQDNET